MATWREIVDHIGRHHRLDRDGGTEIAVTVPTDGGRNQRVLVTHHEALGADILEVRSAFADAARFDADALLGESLDLPIGAIARHGTRLLVVDKTPMGDMPAAVAVFLVEAVAHTADRLEQRMGQDRY